MTSNDPKSIFPGGFCVLMAVYAKDDADLFRRAADSVLSNTLLPDRFILVVDGPVSSNISEVISEYWREPQKDVIYLPRNVGLAKALNSGLERINTEWVVRADADDFNLPHRFEHLAAAIQKSVQPVDVIGSAIREVDRDGKGLSVRRPPLSHAQIAAQLPRRNPMNHMAVAYRTAVVRKVEGYPQVHLKEDYALWCALMNSKCQFLNLHEVLVHATTGIDMYRRRGGWSYIRSEIDIQAFMVNLGLKHRLAAISDGLMRSMVFALPSSFRGIIYRHMLRSRDEE